MSVLGAIYISNIVSIFDCFFFKILNTTVDTSLSPFRLVFTCSHQSMLIRTWIGTFTIKCAPLINFTCFSLGTISGSFFPAVFLQRPACGTHITVTALSFGQEVVGPLRSLKGKGKGMGFCCLLMPRHSEAGARFINTSVKYWA